MPFSTPRPVGKASRRRSVRTRTLSARERQIVRSFIRAAEALAEGVDSEVIRRLIARGLDSAADALSMGDFISQLEDMVSAVQREVAVSGVASVADLPTGIRAMFSFDTLDPRAIAFARAQAGRLIAQITDDTRRMTQRVLVRSIERGLTTRQTAAELRQIIGLHDKWATAVLNAKDRELARLLDTGMSPSIAEARADRFAERYRQRLLRARAQNIARTEIHTAAKQGQYLGWAQGVEQGYISPNAVKRWITGPMLGTLTGKMVCDACAAMAGEERKWDQEFSNGVRMPPAHPSCRCDAILVPASIDDVRDRLRRTQEAINEGKVYPLAEDYSAADVVARAASIAEPSLTSSIQGLAAQHNGQLAGLEHRLKSRNSIADKIVRTRYETPGMTAAEAAEQIKDAVRFTIVLPAERYGMAAQDIVDQLRANGQTVKVKNYWKRGGDYKGVNTQVFDPETGKWYEIQYHTQASLEIKEATHDMYEQSRQAASKEIAAKLQLEMIQISDAQRFPVNAPIVKRKK